MSKRIIALFLTLAMVLTLFVACGSAKGNNVVNATMGPEPETIDPGMANTADAIAYVAEMFEGLMRMDKDGKIVNGVAKEYKVSDDGLTYTFILRDDAKWSDGEAVKAADFEFAWKRAADPKTASPYASMMGYIKNGDDITAGKAQPDTLGVVSENDSTLVVTLKSPCSYFLELTHFPTYAPLRKDIVEKNGAKWIQKPETYISNGPYKMTEWKHNSEIVMMSNDYYWDKTVEREISEVHWKLTDDFSAVLNSFDAGTMDYTDASIPPQELPNLIKDGKITAVPEVGTNYIDFNVKLAPLDNLKVRQALSLAIDRQFICDKVLQGGQQPAVGLIPTSIAGWTDGQAPVYLKATPDIEGAKKLLAEAGYPEGKGLPEIELSTNANATNNKLVEALQSQFAAIGVKTKIASMEWNVFDPYRRGHKNQISRDAWGSDYMDAASFLLNLMSSSEMNYSDYTNPQYDELVNKAQITTDTAARIQLLKDAEKLLMDDACIAPISSRVKNTLLNPELKGVVLHPLGYVMFEYAHFEK